MEAIILIVVFILGCGLLWKGGDWLVDGASGFARRFGISEYVIGLTIVAFGTSAPELAVSVLASLQDKPDLILGNILGSNLANILLILGVAGSIKVIRIPKKLSKEIVISILCTIGLWAAIAGSPAQITRTEGLLMLLALGAFIYFYQKKETSPESTCTKTPLSTTTFQLIAGFICLPLGGKFLIDSAVKLSTLIGIPEAIIALVAIAIGTSLPELATSIAAIKKDKGELVIGNVIGSNIFNILLIVGLSSTLKPLPFNPIFTQEIILILIASILLIAISKLGKKHELSRVAAGALLLIYLVYIGSLII